MQRYAIVQHIPRFFWPPHGAVRRPPRLARQMVGLWLFPLAFGAGPAAVGWDGELGMTLLLLFCGDVINGVRCRWTATLAAIAVRRLQAGSQEPSCPDPSTMPGRSASAPLSVSRSGWRLAPRSHGFRNAGRIGPHGGTTPGSAVQTLREGRGTVDLGDNRPAFLHLHRVVLAPFMPAQAALLAVQATEVHRRDRRVRSGLVRDSVSGRQRTACTGAGCLWERTRGP